MASNLTRYRADLEKLVALGDKMQNDLSGRVDSSVIDATFENEYQRWYTEAYAVIRQLIPDRVSEFQELYKGDVKRTSTSNETYTIQDWLKGVRATTIANTLQKHFNDRAIAEMRFRTQRNILRAAGGRLDSSLHDMQQLVQADLFDSELEAAKELARNGFLRPAGAIAGVVLERHLGQVVANHSLTIQKQHPAISDFNDLLKSGGVLDVPSWRNIQRLGDIRNLCDHNKHRDPTAGEIDELINGVDKISKTLF